MKAIQQQSEQITLYYREGASDKIYQVALEPSGNLFVVNFAYGRRGSTLNTGTKTSRPVDYREAKCIYEKLVKEKMAKGYTPGADGTPYVGGGHSDKQVSGYLPQLLNPIEETEMHRLIRDNVHCAQEKFDGRRRLLRKQDTSIDGINRKGLVVGLPESVFQAFRLIPGDCVLDGESIGDVYHAFDILNLNGTDLRPLPYRDRSTALINVLAAVQQKAIRFSETAYTMDQKSRLLATLQANGAEGIVFKRLDAPYTVDRPNSGGPQLKHKFYTTLSAVVSKLNAQRSVEIRLIGKNGWEVAGNVTIPPNHRMPTVGQVIEVRYLYAFPESGIVYQPVYLGERADVEPHECLLAQLKFKATDAEVE